MLLCIQAHPQCPSVNEKYKDLENWVHGNAGPGKNNGLIVQVTIINQASADGTHFYSGWGVSCFAQGVNPYAQCSLTTNPSLNFVYSDRYNKDQPYQPFDMQTFDVQKVSLDIVNDKIISESITWNYSVEYTNVIRMGDIIYGTMQNSMIILNIKRVVQGQILDCGYPY
jgi:hypothetical protein